MSLRLLLALILTAVLFGCKRFEATGDPFTELDSSAEAALIYLYRVPVLEGAAAPKCKVSVDPGGLKATLQLGGYLAFYAKPGEMKISTSSGGMCSFAADAGSVYFVRLGPRGIVVRLEVVDKSEALEEIANCRLNATQLLRDRWLNLGEGMSFDEVAEHVPSIQRPIRLTFGTWISDLGVRGFTIYEVQDNEGVRRRLFFVGGTLDGFELRGGELYRWEPRDVLSDIPGSLQSSGSMSRL